MADIIRGNGLWHWDFIAPADKADAHARVLAATAAEYVAAYERAYGERPDPDGGPRVVIGDEIAGHPVYGPPTKEELDEGIARLQAMNDADPVARTRRKMYSEANAAEAAFRVAGMRGIDASNLDSIPPPEWLLHGLLTTDSLAMLYGASGVGKSFVAVDWAMTVATGISSGSTGNIWEDDGPVVYVAAEGAAGMRRRIAAWRSHHETDLRCRSEQYDNPMVILPEAIDLGDPVAVEAMARALAEVRPSLVVIDTLARCSAGLDENSARDMSLVVGHLDRLRQASEACVLVIHHSGKDAGAGARGSSALRAAMDTEIAVVGGGASGLRIEVRKQKDAPEADPIGAHLVTEGDSAVITPGRKGAGAKDDRVLDALRRIDVREGVSAKAWQTSAGIRQDDFYVARSALLADGEVENIGSTGRPKYRITTS